jgi:dephospho-CoA kinase
LRPPPTKSPPTSPSSLKRPVAVAITGGIGAGKTEALQAFARLGAATVSSDEIVHHLLRTDDGVKRAIVERLGEGVLTDDGEIDRERVAERVFADRGELEWLESLLHPLVSREYLNWREQLAQLPEPPKVSVTEVPLLYEVGGETRFDRVVAVAASPDVREARLGRPVHAREARLLPDTEKLARADFRYVNDGTREELDAFASDVMTTLTGR